MTRYKYAPLILLLIICSYACGDDDTSGAADQTDSIDTPMSFVQACNLHCEYSHDEPEGCADELSESLNACLQSCAQEDAMTMSQECEAVGVSYYRCTWDLTFACPEGQGEPIPSNLSDCAEESGAWNACLLAG